MAWRLTVFDSAWVVGLVLTGACVGLLAGIDPMLAITAALGLGFALLVMASLSVGLVCFTLLTFFALIPAYGAGAAAFLKVAGLLLALSWIAVLATRVESRANLLDAHPALAALLLGFLAWVALSATWAGDTAGTMDALFRYALNAILLLIIFTAVRDRRHVIWLATAFVFGASASAVWGIVVGPDEPGSERLATSIANPNQLASLLVIGVVLGIALAGSRQSEIAGRVAAGVAAAVCLVGIMLTLSRGGIVALALAAVAAIAFGGRWRGPIALLACLAALAGIAYFATVASPEARERLTSAQEDRGAGRVDLWTVGWRMVEANPVSGVGAGNFASSSIDYLLEPGALPRSDLIVDRPEGAHNMYLEVLAETGVVGIALFAGLLILSLSYLVRAAHEFREGGDAQMEMLARAVFVALIGVLAADFFGSRQFAKELWLLLALGPALLAMARSQRRGPSTSSTSSTQRSITTGGA